MADAGSSTSSDTAKPRLGPRSKIVIPEAFTKSGSIGRSTSVAPASERTIQTQDNGLPLAAQEPAVVAEVAAAAPAPAEVAVVSPKPESLRPAFAPISPGLSSVKLPLGPSPKDEAVSGVSFCVKGTSCRSCVHSSVSTRQWWCAAVQSCSAYRVNRHGSIEVGLRRRFVIYSGLTMGLSPATRPRPPSLN